jgi:hypothetical protein
MSSREMRRIIESMESAQFSEDRREALPGDGSFVATFIDLYGEDGGEELIRKAIKMGGGDPKKSSMALYDLTTKNGQGDTDLADLLKAYMVMDKFVAVYPDAKDIAKQAWKNTGGDLRNMADEMYDLTTKNGQGDTDLASAFNAMAGIKD